MRKRFRVRLAAIRLVALTTVVATAVLAASSSGGGATYQKVKLPMKTIGVMGPVNAAEIIKLGTDATVAAAKALGWKTIQVDPNGDPAKMASGMTSLVNSHVDAIVLTTIEPVVVAAGLRAAKKAGIPVIETLTQVTPNPGITAYYTVFQAPEVQLILNRMKKDLPAGTQIGTISLPQFSAARVPIDLLRAFAAKVGWKIVANHDSDLQNLIPDVKKSVGDMINANPDLKVIFGCCDFTPTAAVPAIKASGKKVAVYSMHGIPSIIRYARSGDAVLEISDYQKGSFIAIDQLARHWATGAPIPKNTPKQYAFRILIADKSNSAKGYPFPSSQMLAQFKARWNKLYVKAG